MPRRNDRDSPRIWLFGPVRWVVVVFVCLGIVSCSDDTVSVAASSVSPASVKVEWDLVYGADGPPIAMQVEPLAGGQGSWGSHDVVIRGAQIEYVVDLGLVSEEFRASGAELVPIEPVSERLIQLGFQDTARIRVTIDEELPAGRHSFDLAMPVWINSATPQIDPADDEVTLSLIYTVQSATDQQEVAAFCDEVVALTNGRTPDVAELDRIAKLAGTEIGPDQAAQLSVEVHQLREDLVEFRSGGSTGYDTGPVNEIIGSVCNVEMLSESLTVD